MIQTERSGGKAVPQIRVGGVVVDVLSRDGWAQRMVDYCRAGKPEEREPFVVFSVNGQVVVTYAQDKNYRALMDQADALDADGQPLVIASRLLTKTPLPERVATTDFFHNAARAAQEVGLNFYLLGSTPENHDVAVKEIGKMYPKLRIVGHRHGYFKPEEESQIIKDIVATKTDVLWVGMGVPRQESFVLRNRERLRGVGWVKTCGGLFDYFTPEIKRAPAWMQACGLEWLFRTIQEPRKYFWRYFSTNGAAMWLLLTRTGDMR